MTEKVPMSKYHDPELFPLVTMIIDIASSSDEVTRQIAPLLASLKEELVRLNGPPPPPAETPDVTGVSSVMNIQARSFLIHAQSHPAANLVSIAQELAREAELQFDPAEHKSRGALFHWYDVNWEAIAPHCRDLTILTRV